MPVNMKLLSGVRVSTGAREIKLDIDFLQGVQAYQDGQRLESCPHTVELKIGESKRDRWIHGFKTAEIAYAASDESGA